MKTIAELIVNRITDTVLIPNDPQKVYDLKKIIDNLSTANVDRIDALQEEIKASSDVLTLRSLFDSERTMLHALTESETEDTPYAEMADTRLLLLSAVSLLRGDSDITPSDWTEYFKTLAEHNPATYQRVMNKAYEVNISANEESSVLASIDFLS